VLQIAITLCPGSGLIGRRREGGREKKEKDEEELK
jgi:hypothetical protein